MPSGAILKSTFLITCTHNQPILANSPLSTLSLSLSVLTKLDLSFSNPYSSADLLVISPHRIFLLAFLSIVLPIRPNVPSATATVCFCTSSSETPLPRSHPPFHMIQAIYYHSFRCNAQVHSHLHYKLYCGTNYLFSLCSFMSLLLDTKSIRNTDVLQKLF